MRDDKPTLEQDIELLLHALEGVAFHFRAHGALRRVIEAARQAEGLLQAREEETDALIKGAEERSRLLLDAKNRWADRARAAEARAERLRDALRELLDQIDEITSDETYRKERVVHGGIDHANGSACQLCSARVEARAALAEEPKPKGTQAMSEEAAGVRMFISAVARVQFAMWVDGGARCAQCLKPYASTDDMIERNPRATGSKDFDRMFVDAACWAEFMETQEPKP